MRPLMRYVLLLFALALTVSGCKEDENKPYLEFAGGGFIFNYRTADAFYGFVAKPLRPLPEGAVIEVEFEMPNKAPPHKVTQKIKGGQLQYSFRTPDLTGIEKGKPYQVVLRLLEEASGRELGRYTKSFHTDIDQASLPTAPLSLGPAYMPNPEVFKPAPAPKTQSP
jgi:hypothetical protein